MIVGIAVPVKAVGVGAHYGVVSDIDIEIKIQSLVLDIHLRVLVNKPLNLGVIVSVDQIVHTELTVVVVAGISKRLFTGEAAGRGGNIAPGVIGVGGPPAMC